MKRVLLAILFLLSVNKVFTQVSEKELLKNARQFCKEHFGVVANIIIVFSDNKYSESRTKYINEEIVPGKQILSPFRNENNPSFGLFIGDGGEICFKDFKLGGGDCITFVKTLFNLTYFEACSKIAIDFGMGDDFIVKKYSGKLKIAYFVKFFI